MTYLLQVQSELFALIGVGIFLALSLLTYRSQDRFPNRLPYVYQFGAFLGFLCLVVSRFVFFGTEEPLRFWYSYCYLVAGLANIVGANFYLVAPKRQYGVSRIWLVAVTVPSIIIGTFFTAQYGLTHTTMLPTVLNASLLIFGASLGVGVSLFVSSRISDKLLGRTKEVTH